MPPQGDSCRSSRAGRATWFGYDSGTSEDGEGGEDPQAQIDTIRNQLGVSTPIILIHSSAATVKDKFEGKADIAVLQVVCGHILYVYLLCYVHIICVMVDIAVLRISRHVIFISYYFFCVPKGFISYYTLHGDVNIDIMCNV